MEIEKEIKQKHFPNVKEKAIVNISFTESWINSRLIKLLRPYGISPQQYNILRILRGQKQTPVTVKSITERMLDKMSNASRLIEKLRIKGLIERKENKADRRAVDVVITDKGMETLEKLDPKIINMSDEIVHLTDAETETLNSLLDKLRG